MSNRKFEAQKLSEVLNQFSSLKPIAKGLEELKINKLWKQIMGENISVYTERVKLEKAVLYVKIKSPTLKEELRFGENRIIKLLNQNLKNKLIKKIIFH
ncbi:MAG: DUF721 domain-containing protein [Flavobacteriaceae bacterium]|nr:DUF721 domain-containing protein [Flavobacteriaceae bacterium]